MIPKLIQENPNDKVLTYELEGDHLHLGPSGKILIPRTSASLLEICPFAKDLMKLDIKRIDYAMHKGNTRISFTRKFEDWQPAQRAIMFAMISNNIKNNVPLVIVEKLKEKFEIKPAFTGNGDNFKENIKSIFDEAVNPVLEKDGGAMQLLKIDVNQEGKVSVDVALAGSCNDCSSALTSTLKDAEQVLKATVEQISQIDPAKSHLSFDRINQIETAHLIIGSPA